MTQRILIIEDDAVQREMLTLLLRRRTPYESRQAEDGAQGLGALEHDPDIALVILDLNLPDMSGMDVLEAIARLYTGLPVIILTGRSDTDSAVKAMRAGAYDYLTKPLDAARLEVAIQNALKTSQLEKEVQWLKRKNDGAFTFDRLIGHEAGLSGTIKIGRKAAASDIPVLLTGETGVGKEVFARAIHGESRRGGGPFIAVNCGAIPAQLVESVLFGHEKGAFTGAIAKSPGLFREAEGGTIFLDEIGDLPLEAQVKLLRVVQQREVAPVGGERPVPVDVRILSATNRDLGADVKAGRFREDLYFRLNVLMIALPALRERRADIPALAHHFIATIATRDGLPTRTLAPEALAMLNTRPWPGNVRELENVIYRAMALGEGDVLRLSDFSVLAADIANPLENLLKTPKQNIALMDINGALRAMDDLETEILKNALTVTRGNVTQAARALGIAKSTFYRKMKELEPP